MTWDANRHVIRKIKTAITAGIRPLSLIFHEQPQSKWERFDFLLLEAYQILQDETCPKCGNFVWLCRSDNAFVEFRVQEDVCMADKKMEEYKSKKSKAKPSKEDKARWGVISYTTLNMLNDQQPPTRKEYYESLAKVE